MNSKDSWKKQASSSLRAALAKSFVLSNFKARFAVRSWLDKLSANHRLFCFVMLSAKTAPW